MSVIGNSPTYAAFTVKSATANSTYYYCGVSDSALSITVVVFFLIGYALPLIAISALYILIASHVQRHRRRVAGPTTTLPAVHRNARTVRLIVTVVVVFAISWLPVHLQSLAAYLGFHSPDGAVYEVFRVVWNCMAYSNSCANPFIYHCRANSHPAPRSGRLVGRRQPVGGRVLPQCCTSTTSFRSSIGRQRGQRTRSTYIRHTTCRTRHDQHQQLFDT